jgi:TatD DNase family protein
MNHPSPEDFIDIHNHGARPVTGVFQVENIMTHEKRQPTFEEGLTFTIGIHPWNISRESLADHLRMVQEYSAHENIIALGEAGYDRIKGPEKVLQKEAFYAQVKISEEVTKPLFIHCVRAWDELLAAHKQYKPLQPWIVHGFRGNPELANQLLSRGMYLSFWYDFIIRPESTPLVLSLPPERIFLETDGSNFDIRKIYSKVSIDMKLTLIELKAQIYSNFISVFK